MHGSALAFTASVIPVGQDSRIALSSTSAVDVNMPELPGGHRHVDGAGPIALSAHTRFADGIRLGGVVDEVWLGPHLVWARFPTAV